MLLFGIIGAVLSASMAFLSNSEYEQPTWDKRFLPDENDDSFLRFVGGDGVNKVAGKMHYPTGEKGEGRNHDNIQMFPTIVLAHGIGLTQDCSLDRYTRAFTEAGFAAFTFDYTTFGQSEGWPRQQASAKTYVADIEAVISYLKTESTNLHIDKDRIGLWGTSFGGGHAVVVASKDPTIKAIVSQVPAIRSAGEISQLALKRDPKVTLIAMTKLTGSIIHWIFSSIFFRTTIYVPLVGMPGSNAIMQNPGDDEGYKSIAYGTTQTPKWQNAVTVGSALEATTYRPLNFAKDVKCPSLLISAEDDTLCPAFAVKEAADLIPNSKYMNFESTGHFDVYSGETFDEIV